MITLKNAWENRGEIIARLRNTNLSDKAFGMMIVAETEEDFKDILCNNYSFINRMHVLDSHYLKAWDFSNGIAMVRANRGVGLYGFIDRNNEFVVECAYRFIGRIEWGFYRCIDEKSRLYGFLNENGEEVIPCQYLSATSMDETAKVQKQNGEYVWIDQEGNETNYRRIFKYKDGIAKVLGINGLYGFINLLKDEIVPCKYSRAYGFREGRASVVNEDGLYGCINLQGKEDIPCEYYDAGQYNEGMAYVCNYGELYGFIDIEGKVKVPLKYKSVDVFNNGRCMVMNSESLWGIINKDGEEIAPHKYRSNKDSSGGIYPVQTTNFLWGFLNSDGDEIISCQYISTGDIEDGFVEVEDIKGDCYCLEIATGKLTQ